jgi:hypothetical protein
MIAINDAFLKDDLYRGCALVLQIHDELVYEGIILLSNYYLMIVIILLLLSYYCLVYVIIIVLYEGIILLLSCLCYY